MRPRLDLESGQSCLVSGSGEGLDVFAAPIGDPSIEARIGRETVADRLPQALVGGVEVIPVLTSGAEYKTTTGKIVGGRLLLLPVSDTQTKGPAAAAANWTRIGQRVLLSNIYVHPDFRRVGMGAWLVETLKTRWPTLRADNSFTEAGAAFMGYPPSRTPGDTPEDPKSRKPRL